MSTAPNPRSNGSVVSSLSPIEISRSEEYFRGVAAVLRRLPCAVIDRVTEALWQAYLNDRAIFIFGNGGSAALASHCACDLTKGTSVNGGRRLRALALTDNIPLMTAWANDASYEDIFAEQLVPVVNECDIALAISGSGNSPNVLKGLHVSRQAGLFTIGLTGFQGGKMKSLCDLCVVVPSDNMQVIEDLHVSVSHSIFTCLRNRISNLNSQELIGQQA